MKFCNKCGAQLEDAMLFCNQCGAKQEVFPAAAEVPAAAPVSETPAEVPVNAVETAPVAPAEAPVYAAESAPVAPAEAPVNAVERLLKRPFTWRKPYLLPLRSLFMLPRSSLMRHTDLPGRECPAAARPRSLRNQRRA